MEQALSINEIFWGIPLTKALKKIAGRSEVFFFDFEFTKEVRSRAILSQIRLVDARRLATFMGYFEPNDFYLLKEKLKALIP